MTPAEQFEQLRSEKELLQIELQDVNYMIRIREEELAILREKARKAIECQSKLVENLYEIEQMQNNLGEQQQKAEGAALREAALEEELMVSIRMEQEFYTIQQQFSSSQAAVNMLNGELVTASDWHKQLVAYKARVTELESNLEIALLDNDSFKDDINELREQLEALQKSLQ